MATTTTKKNKNSDEEVWNQDQQNNFILNTYQYLLPEELRTEFHEIMVIYGKEDYEYVQEFVKDLQNELKDPQISVVLYDDKQYKCFFHSQSKNNNEDEPSTGEPMEVENVEEKSEEERGDDAADTKETEMSTSTISDSIDGEKVCASGDVSDTQLIGANCDREKLCHHASVILVFLTKNMSNQSFDKDMKDFLVLLSRTEANVVPVYTTSSTDNKEKTNDSGSVETERFFLGDITGVQYSSGMFNFLTSFKGLVVGRFPVNAHKKDVRRSQKISWLKYRINDKKKLGQFSGLLSATQKEIHKLKEDLDFEDENRCTSILKSDDLQQQVEQQQEKQVETEKGPVEPETKTEKKDDSRRDSAEKVFGILADYKREEPGEKSNDTDEELTYKNDLNLTEQRQNQSQSGGADGNDDVDDKIRASQLPPPPPYCRGVSKENDEQKQPPEKGPEKND